MKYLASFLLLLSLFVFSRCQTNEKPANVLGKEKMVNLLVDLHLVEAFVNSNYPMTDSARYLYKKWEDSTLKAHGTDHIAFDSSMAYYKRNIKLLDEIYVSVVDSLSLKEASVK